MIPQKATYSIAKAIHHANAAAFYLELTITEAQATGTAKDLLKSYANKFKWVLNDLQGRIRTDEAKEALKGEMQDPLMLDAFSDTVLTLTPENRDKLESFLNELITKQSLKRA